MNHVYTPFNLSDKVREVLKDSLPGIRFFVNDGKIHLLAPKGFTFDANTSHVMVCPGVEAMKRSLGYGFTVCIDPNCTYCKSK